MTQVGDFTLMQPDNGDPLGRLYLPDPRDYLLAEALAEREPDSGADLALQRGYRYWWQDGWWGDQWYTPQCVAYSWVHLIEDGPVTYHSKTPNREAVVEAQGNAIVNPDALYRQAQDLDYWPGNDYDGTSVRGGAKALVRRGLISSYHFAYTVEETVDAIIGHGPGIAGTWWYDSMFDPDDEGNLEVSGKRAGGHAYVVNGVNIDMQVFRIKNSWGRGWGRDGNGYISFEDFERLLAEQGEFCFAFEINN